MFVAFNVEDRVPEDHPLRAIKRFCDRVLAKMSRDFNRAYGTTGNVSIPPESLIKALLLRALYSIPSERRLCEAIEYNFLYRWFIDWPVEKPMWTPEAFSMNRPRFELHDLVGKFFNHVVAEGLAERLIGDEHFTVDGTLIRSLAGHKSIKPIDDDRDDDDGNGWSSFKGGKRSNQTHRSVVDSEARLASRGGEAHLSHSMHLLTDSHSGLCVGVSIDAADGRAERRNALTMLDRVSRRHRITPKALAADANYTSGEFLCAVESRGITPHAAMPKTKIKGDTAAHRARRRAKRRMRCRAYRASQRMRKFIEPVIGWCKHIGGLGRTRFIGHERIQHDAMMVTAAWNLLRMTRLAGAT
ncbi:MAG: IS5 family transposase [Bradyrhizobium sp.]|nr:IS5 family transposase [Bradyrhizobium sp.]